MDRLTGWEEFVQLLAAIWIGGQTDAQANRHMGVETVGFFTAVNVKIGGGETLIKTTIKPG